MKRTISAILLFLLLLPNVATAGWVYIDTSASSPVVGVKYDSSVSPNFMRMVANQSFNTTSFDTVTNWYFYSTTTNATWATVVNPLSTPAPTGYFSQTDVDAAVFEAIAAYETTGFVDGSTLGFAIIGACCLAATFGLIKKAMD